MNEFGPWLFATALVISLTYIFVNVISSRKWFGFIAFVLLVTIGSLIGYSSLEATWKTKERHIQLSEFEKKPLLSSGTNIENIFVFLTQENATVVSNYLGDLKSVVIRGEPKKLVVLKDLSVAVSKAAAKGNFEDAEKMASIVDSTLSNRFSKYRDQAN